MPRLSRKFYCCSILLLLFSLPGFTPSFADEVYKYKNRNGNWVFSKSPSNSGVDKIIRIKNSEEKRLYSQVWVKEQIGRKASLSIINKYYGPVQAVLTLNCDSCEVKSKTVDKVIESSSKMFALKIDPNVRDRGAHYTLAVVLGDPNAKPDLNFSYRLPFQELVDFQVTQSFNGVFSHHEAISIHSIDIAMPISTPVLAARGGVVMGIEESNAEAGTSVEYASKANTVYVHHSDGTIGVYAHLDMYSVEVKPGQIVEVGDMLARSGNTGFSTGPHLHFTVWTNDSGVQKSIYFRFDDGVGGSFLPHSGERINHGFGKVKIFVPELYVKIHKNSVINIASLEGIHHQVGLSSVKDVVEETSGRGQSLLDQIKNLFE